MKIVRTNIVYISIVWILIIVLLGSVLYISYSRNVKDLRQLMVNEAQRLADIVTVATAVGIDALEDIEYLTAFRLLDNARFIDRISYNNSYNVLTADSLAFIAREHDLYAIEILDKNGNTIVQSGPSRDERDLFRNMYSNEIESVLTGESRGEFLGFDKKRYKSGMQKGVVLRRNEGGAVIIQTGMDKMLEYRKSFGLGTLGTLFNGISKDKGVSYIVLQDTLGIVVASPNVSEITRIGRDPFLVEAFREGWGYRTIQVNDEEILEVVSSLVMNERNHGLLRIGLTTHAIEDIKQRAVRHFIILFTVSLFSGAFLLLYVILRQNYMILNKEHDRILKEVKVMEEETRRSERLASMGNLAAGVAHEIRNPLNSINLIIQQLKEELYTDRQAEEHRSMLSTVGNEITRISAIIEHFLRFARPPELSLMTIPLDQLISEVLGVVEVKARMNHISISTFVEPDVKCFCDADQIKQALVNIVLNAIEEVQKDGKITIHAGKQNTMIYFQIGDSGGGMDTEILPKIFDPYFTTKDSGMGLGLSEVFRIVTAHGGKIFAENSTNNGAVFSIRLPVKDK